MAVDRFEDLLAWRSARGLTREVYRITRIPPLAKDFGLCNQLQRASVSVMANIAEGFERGSLAEFRQFLAIAKGSSAEVRSLLYVAMDAGHVDEVAFRRLMDLSLETGRLVAGLRKSIDKKIRSVDEERGIYDVARSDDREYSSVDPIALFTIVQSGEDDLTEGPCIDQD